MAFHMRKSKFRHVFGKALKRDQCYDGIRVTKTTWDSSTFCSVNPKYVAVVSEAAGGGAFLVLPLTKIGRVERDSPVVAGHKAAVLDIEWCPHNDDVIASASEDCTVKVWQIPEGGLKQNLTDCVADLVAHQRRVGLVKWHPTAQNILLSAGSDNKIFIWNCGTCEPLVEIEVPDQILSAAFNYNGSKVVTTCKDKKMRVLNPRTGEILAEGKPHEGAKGSQAVYTRSGKIFTTGFSRMGERQYALWDEKNLKSNMVLEEIDQSNGILFPFYDGDTDMVYLCGKGDSLIRYYEISNEEPYVHYLALYSSSDPQRGMGYMPKRGLQVNNCEIARIYKLHNSGLCEVIPFTVPRKSELFQSDLYPDTPGDIPAVSAEDWFNGKDADPILISLQQEGSAPTPQAAVVRKSNVLDKPVGVSSSSSTPARPPQHQQQQQQAPTPAPAPAPAPVVNSTQSADASAAAAAPALPPGFDPIKMKKELQELKDMVKLQDKHIKKLEERLETLEAADDAEDEDHQTSQNV